MWSALADAPSIASSAAQPALPPIATFKFNFGGADDAEASDDATMGDSETGTAAGALAAPTVTRPAVQHRFEECAAPLPPTADQLEVIVLNAASSTFTVESIASAQHVAQAQPAAGSNSPLTFYKRRTKALGAHSASLASILSDSDLRPQVYEGGFKLWECAVDLLLFLRRQLQLGATGNATSLFSRGLAGARVCELGCGHAFPALFTLEQGAARVAMQDFNAEVIRDATIDNARINLAGPPTLAATPASTTNTPAVAVAPLVWPTSSAELASRSFFFSGDWSDPQLLSLLGTESYDLLLTSDTLYSSEYMAPLFDLMTHLLAPNGLALIAAKRYYFGIGGSTLEFTDLVRTRGRGAWECTCVDTIEDGKSNIREILLLRRKQAS